MADFADVVRNRRMTRSFASTPVEPSVIDELVDLGLRAPSAGKTQGWHLVVLEGATTATFWDITLPRQQRSTFRWRHLLDAPVIALPLADSSAYVARYAEPDKARTGLGAGAGAWPVPYWTIDTSMAVMTILLAAENVGLGALFFGVFRNEPALRSALGIPDHLELLGAVALGYPRQDATESGTSGRSAPRRRRTASEVIHRSGW